ncbi:MAG: glycosyltransferase [Flavobacterium sp.]|nr:MAG: glycosyltransferase [Flavobacterium sp.]
MKKLFVIGHTFPEPSTTAAGVRMMQLIDLFRDFGYHITFGSTALATGKSATLEELGIEVVTIKLNHPSFDEMIGEMDPRIVIFDRYITEEQFGWRVTQTCPGAIRILDTEDLHFLRKARELAIQEGVSVSEANIYTDQTKREIASILRSDLSLIISEAELELLQEEFRIPTEILFYLPFMMDMSRLQEEEFPNFEQRRNMVTIGNFQHAPNLDSVTWMATKIWPGIRKALPSTELHIYGNYAPQQITQLHNEHTGFHVKGWVEDVDQVMQDARLCLAPLRFGAGLKGKFLDAMRNGTPVVTTAIGAEGINGELPFCGLVEEEPKRVIEAAIGLYTNENSLKEARRNGFEILQTRFDLSLFSEKFTTKIKALSSDLPGHRTKNFIGQVLQHQSLQASKYMSKWIELKNRS